MKTITISVKDLTLEALLLREADPRMAICQDRVVLLNRFDRVIADRDLLNMFTTTEQVDARISSHFSNETLVAIRGNQEPMVIGKIDLDKLPQTTRVRDFKLHGDMANEFNESQGGVYGFDDDDTIDF
jgi:hypothetical protein